MSSAADQQNALSLSRRGFLTGVSKTTLLGAVLLSVGGGAAWLTSTKASRAPDLRYRTLRKNDVKLFSSVLPAIIPQANDAESQRIFLASMDSMLLPSNAATRAQLRKMVDTLTALGTRTLLMQTLSDWPQLSVPEVEAILQRWRGSNRAVLNIIYSTITGLCNLAWYMVPEHQLESGYPGPPKKLVSNVNGLAG